jgi:hypothetical protein
MSIAAVSNPSAANASQRAAASVVAAPQPVRGVAFGAREPGRRHELVDALREALGVKPEGDAKDKSGSQAIVRFTHALMNDLRTLAGEDHDGVRTAERRSWGDLSQRLSALGTAAAQPAAPVAEVPDQPNPVTTATMAVHIMKVPSSRLLEAFVAMHRALGQQSDSLSAADARRALAELANKMAASMAPTGASAVAAGAVLDLRI